MLADLEHLIELQQTDLRLRELTRQIAVFPQRRAEAEAERARARDTVARHRTAHTDSLKLRKKLELDAQQFEERIGKHKTQMYEVKSNEAYRALQHEVESDEKLKVQAEDRVLEAMIAAEELEKAIKAAEADLKEVEQRVAVRLRALEEEEAVEKKEAAALVAQRDALRVQTSEEMLNIYDRIAHGHGGIALAEARGEVCQVCLIHIRPQTFAEVKRNDHIHYCESCHRILYYVPAAPPSGVEQPV
ncbi:MAG: zinc ribbon domain-containing protein, partial [Candidatus Acidiferrales bacterium]